MRRRVLALLLPLAALTAAPWPVAAAGHVVRITAVLEPLTLTVAVGDTVTWRNDDGERHRVRSRNGPVEFDSGDIEPGEAYTFAFTVAGTHPYVDERNDDAAGYHGSIIVTTRGEQAPTTPDGSAAPGDGADPGAAPATEATIGMSGRRFGPSSVTVAVGSTVIWRNDDDRQHTATSTGDGFDSGVLSPGETFSQTFETAGTFRFLCAIHTDMTGTITVSSDGAAAGAGGPQSAGLAGSAPSADASAGPSADPAPSPTQTPTPTPTPTGGSTSSPASVGAGAGGQTGAGGRTAADAAAGEAAPGDATGVAAATPTSAGGLVSAVLALVLIGGALVAGTAILLGVVRRADAGVLP